MSTQQVLLNQSVVLNRRDLLNLGLATTGAVVLTAGQPRLQAAEPQARGIIDTNVSLFQWPFRRLPLDETSVLIAKLGELGIAQAWAASLEGLLHRDISAVNQRLATACQHHRELIPIGTINPELPDWQSDLQRCVEQYEMPGIRLYPSFHGYRLDDPRFTQLLSLATAAGRFVQLVTAMEDTRMQHALVRVADVDLAALPQIMSKVTGARVQLLNYRPSPATLDSLAMAPGVYFDTARVEGTDGVPQLVQRVAPGRVFFGSHAPLLIPEAALIRVYESGLLNEAQLGRLWWDNAAAWTGATEL